MAKSKQNFGVEAC